MASSHTALPPSPPFQPELVADLRSDLAGAGYDVANLGQIIGQVAIAALDREEPLPARDAAAASTEPAALLMRLFALGQERSEEHTSELQSRGHIVCRLLLEKKK